MFIHHINVTLTFLLISLGQQLQTGTNTTKLSLVVSVLDQCCIPLQQQTELILNANKSTRENNSMKLKENMYCVLFLMDGPLTAD